jgi:hypothetical protein
MDAGIGLGTTSRRRKPTVDPCVDNTAKLRLQASALAPRPSTYNEQRAAPRATACTPRSSTCVAPRASAWAPRSSTCDAQPGNGLGATMKYQRRTMSAAANNGLSTTITPPCSAAFFEVNSEPHTGARPSARLCVGPGLARCVHRSYKTRISCYTH